MSRSNSFSRIVSNAFQSLDKSVSHQTKGDTQLLTERLESLAKGDMTVNIPLHGPGDRLGHAASLVADGFREASESARQAMERLDGIPTPVFTVDADFCITYINIAGARMIGVSPEKAVGRKCHSLFRTSHCQTADCRVKQAMERNETCLGEAVSRPDGREIHVRYAGTPLLDEVGRIIGGLEYIVDIGDLKSAMADAQMKVKLLDNIPTPVAAIDRDYSVTYLNPVGARVAGVTSESAKGQRCYNLFSTSICRSDDCLVRKAMQADGVFTGETIARPHGSELPIRITAAPLKDSEGRVTGALEFFLDITAEANVVKVAKQISQGDFAVEVPVRSEGDELGLALVEMTQTLQNIAKVTEATARGEFTSRIDVKGDQDTLGHAINAMTANLARMTAENEKERWIKTGQAGLSERIQGELDLATLSKRVITYLTQYISAQVGVLYLAHNEEVLRLGGSYAFTRRKQLKTEIMLGEGLVGQAALEGELILVTEVPEGYLEVDSGLGHAPPRNIVVVPVLHEGVVKGVLELGSLQSFDDAALELLRAVADSVAIAITSAQDRERLKELLAETQQQSEELQTQQEELKASNEELEEQARALKVSEEKLRAQQEEMEVVNEELEEKNELLERQKRDIERARKELEDKAEELALASKYKSEFLANMSHELRTPLNSLLLLANGLADNREGNLNDDQVESARVIYGSGNDLLNLINEILDLAKIEAGRMSLDVHELRIEELADGLARAFDHVAAEKEISFEIMVEDGAPDAISTDRKRIEQILRNLISNAIKFTDEGGVEVVFHRPSPTSDLKRSGLDRESTLAISVNDTGIGIAPEQQKLVFEAFQQADGGTTRRFGGTGLGLSISRELAGLLGGEISLESEPEKGSTFTLYVPIEAPESPQITPARGVRGPANLRPAESALSTRRAVRPRSSTFIDDDRERIKPEDKVILVIEDDARFAKILYDTCHEKSFKCVAAPTGEAGIDLAKSISPIAVLLDIRLPGMDGWETLHELKEDHRTRHIPVHIVSVEESSHEALRRGAIGHLSKPVEKEKLEQAFHKIEEVTSSAIKRILVVEDDEQTRKSIIELLDEGSVVIDAVANGHAALDALREQRYDCVILDLGLDDIEGETLLRQLSRTTESTPPIIVYTARDLSREDEIALREHAESIILKDVRSQERLLDEVSLFLHQVVSEMPERKRQIITNLHDVEAQFKDKKILIVDDDMRTTFAISQMLTGRGAKTLKAENGQKALLLLEQEPDVDLVLMDIMMPEMDGYEAIKRIRAQSRFSKLPIISLTAKAMKEDRERCISAGASDYLPKPVDQQRLISMLRVWLYR